MIRPHNWYNDIRIMHNKFGVGEWMKTASASDKRKFLAFRLDFIEEEFEETLKAFVENDSEETIDGLIDICVIAIGTLEAFGVDANKAWNAVMDANMAKQVGVKPSRPNPLGLPDLIKPEGWKGPDHSDNYGQFELMFEEIKDKQRGDYWKGK